MSDRLTLAASTGLPLLALAFHVASGTVALVAGWVAIVARKGGTSHRRGGLVFVCAMIAMGLSAVGITVYEGREDVGSGAFAAYLIFTGWTTIRPVAGAGRRVDIALLTLVCVYAAGAVAHAFAALGRPGNQIDGVPAGMLFFLATIPVLAVIGDLRMIRAGGVHGTRRLTRHLWRMCFGLFVASGSFVTQLVRMPFIPRGMRSVPVILVLSAGPIVVLFYWMWRLRRERNLRGLVTAKPIKARVPV